MDVLETVAMTKGQEAELEMLVLRNELIKSKSLLSGLSFKRPHVTSPYVAEMKETETLKGEEYIFTSLLGFPLRCLMVSRAPFKFTSGCLRQH